MSENDFFFFVETVLRNGAEEAAKDAEQIPQTIASGIETGDYVGKLETAKFLCDMLAADLAEYIAQAKAQAYFTAHPDLIGSIDGETAAGIREAYLKSVELQQSRDQ